MRKFFACLAVGKWSEEYFEHYGARWVVSSPHFVDNDWFAGQASDAKRSVSLIRSNFEVPAGRVVFLFVGKFEEKKRPMDLLNTVKIMLERGVRREAFHVLMVGDGRLKKHCERIVKEHNLPVSFTGFMNQSQMPSVYAASDVLVLPSDGRETWGLVVNEAMACGLPAVVSDQVGCAPDLIEEGHTGFVFRCGDTDRLSQIMMMFINNPLQQKMGLEAQRRVSKYSVEEAVRGISQALSLTKR